MIKLTWESRKMAVWPQDILDIIDYITYRAVTIVKRRNTRQYSVSETFEEILKLIKGSH